MQKQAGEWFSDSVRQTLRAVSSPRDLQRPSVTLLVVVSNDHTYGIASSGDGSRGDEDDHLTGTSVNEDCNSTDPHGSEDGGSDSHKSKWMYECLSLVESCVGR